MKKNHGTAEANAIAKSHSFGPLWANGSPVTAGLNHSNGAPGVRQQQARTDILGAGGNEEIARTQIAGTPAEAGKSATSGTPEAKAAISVKVEVGVGLKAGAHFGAVSVEAGGSIRVESEVGTNLKATTGIAGDLGLTAGPASATLVQMEKLLLNQAGSAGPLEVSGPEAGFARGDATATASPDEVSLGLSLYKGVGGGVTVTIRPAQVIEAAKEAVERVSEGFLKMAREAESLLCPLR